MKKTDISPLNNLKPIGSGMSCFEIEYPENSGEYYVYDLGHNEKYISVGSTCNVGLLVDWWIEKDECFSMDEHLEEIYDIIWHSLNDNEELTGKQEI